MECKAGYMGVRIADRQCESSANRALRSAWVGRLLTFMRVCMIPPIMQLARTAHTSQPWRIHAIAPDFRIEDVWALPTPGGPSDFARLVQLTAALNELTDWQREGDAIVRTAKLPTFPAAIETVRAVAEIAEARNHHPDIDIRWRSVTFRCSTHSEGGITDLDIELAKQIDRVLTGATG